ncbi:ATP synthase F1 subunit gamma [Candidatus Saccharibacteria bacterium]|nr:ATP synthase F1 subunit gamma [Candidatus Saccharibacteria bacterium]
MAQTKIIQRRIRSIKNAKQITKALEVVAASRMRKVVEAVQRSRTYGNLASTIMERIAHSQEARQHPLFSRAADKPTLYIVITSDRGQAGAFNSNIFHLTIQSAKTERYRPQVVVYGRKGARFFAHLDGIELKGAYEDIADMPSVNVFAPLIEMIDEAMADGQIGAVKIIYTEFISPLTQKVSSFQLLPINHLMSNNASTMEQSAQQRGKTVYEFEPEIKDVLDEAIKLYFEAKLMQARIESAASEHAMRMVAMGNANRNASDLIDALTLELNATRQAAITQEIAEITGGAEAIAA